MDDGHFYLNIFCIEITYEGVFTEHFYNWKNCESCQDLIQVQAEYAVTHNLFDQKTEEGNGQKQIWASCQFGTINDGKPRDPKVSFEANIVLDISGSMDSKLSNSSNQSQLELAKNAIQQILGDQLKENDSFGLATFNTDGYIIQKLQKVKDLNKQKLLQKIQKIQTCGGTTLKAGLETGISMFKKYSTKQIDLNVNKRIIFITDMMSFDAIELQTLIRDAAQYGVFLSIIGVGVNFDNSITDVISKNQGCNYFSLTNDEELIETVVKGFNYNFFPVAFNVDLKLKTENYEIEEVYGSPFQTKNSGLLDEMRQFQNITEINTVFGSQKNEKGKKGGLILVKLVPKQNQSQNDIQQQIPKSIVFDINYTQTPYLLENGENQKNYKVELIINDINDDQNQNFVYSGTNVLKGIILQKYVEICQQFSNEQTRQKISQFESQQIFSNFQQKLEQFRKLFDNHDESIQELSTTFANFTTIIEKLYNQYIDNFQ